MNTVSMQRLLHIYQKVHTAALALDEEAPECRQLDAIRNDLPMLVVVGPQSVGKSVLLESLVGFRHFLPTGDGIMTRCPLILMLRHMSEREEPFCTFEENGDEFSDFEQVRIEIESRMEKLCKGHTISPTPITLRIHSRSLPDLTLIDLPGLTKIPTVGQPQDIDIQVRSLVSSYTSHPRTVILAVTSACEDISTSDALHFARQVDARGARTIGVVTKCDLSTKLSNTRDVLMNRVYPLSMGFAATACGAVVGEENFFNDCLELKGIRDKCGIYPLLESLTDILESRFRESLPKIEDAIRRMLNTHNRTLLDLGGASGDASDLPRIFLDAVSEFSQNYEGMLDGRVCTDMPLEEYVGGARVHYIMHDWMEGHLLHVGPFDGLSDLEIRATLRNAKGTKSSLFVPDEAFQALARKQMRLLEPSALQCADEVHAELRCMLRRCEPESMKRFPPFALAASMVMENQLSDALASTRRMLIDLFNVELSYINTRHPALTTSPQIKRSHRYEGEPVHAFWILAASQWGLPRHALRCLCRSYQGSSDCSLTDTSTSIQSPASEDEAQPRVLRSPRKQCGSRRRHNSIASMTTSSGSGGASRTLSVSRPIESVRLSSCVSPVASPRPLVFPPVPATVGPSLEISGKETLEIRCVKTLLSSYFEIFKARVVDFVPKCIVCYLVNGTKDAAKRSLISSLYRPEKLSEMLQESKEISRRRSAINASIQKLAEVADELRKL